MEGVMKNVKFIVLFFILVSVVPAIVHSLQAQTSKDTVIATGRFVMGDNDSRSEAREFALLEAKRNAMELFGTYLTSSTTVENYQLTNDQISTFTMGLMQTSVLEEKLETEGELQAMVVKIQAVVNPSEVEQNLEALAAAQQEADDLPSLLPAEPSESENVPAAAENRKTRLREFGRNLLLTRIVVESRKQNPNLQQMKQMLKVWSEKYPRAKFIHGYLGIALFKNGRKAEAVPELRLGLKNLTAGKRLLKLKKAGSLARLATSQQILFNKYLKKAEGRRIRRRRR